MRRLLAGRVLLACALTLCGVNAFAVSLGTDITYFDNRVGNTADPTYNDWWNGGTPDPRVNAGLAVGEDQETEPSTQIGQVWDLEGMYLSGTGILSLVGGYNFSTGVDGYFTGDIFIDINPTFAPTNTGGSTEPPNPTGAGYDFVIDITGPTDPGLPATYSVYAISGLTVGSGLIGTDTFAQSNPWRFDNSYVAGAGQSIALLSSGNAFSMATYGSDAALGVGWDSGYLPSGGTHYVLGGFDLSTFITNAPFYIHYTVECGNDVLTGLVVPEPSTYVLFGLGLAALAARKKFAKAA
ncbi:MAG: PEP-CTERM sorting domain-containing protein [Candidatus Hydrogenedentes bacterium]|nr:PEP-CTERM sorting domain-containing protein [Candidatus Hydrogenedentota bacterium]